MSYEITIGGLIRQWHESTAHLSTGKTDHPLARNIVAMGPAAVPALFAALAQHRPDGSSRYPWSMRLIHEILQDGPAIPEERRGDVRWCVDAYLAWGRERGYLR